MTLPISKPLLVLLASITAISPFAIDTYLSSIPVIAKDLNTETSLVAITVSLYIFGLAIGQLLGGPLSDRFGRKPIIIAGLCVFSCGSFLISTTQSLEFLLLFRLIQAIGGGVAVVGVPAIIRDLSTGKESARLFSLLMLITMIAPSIAPSVGTLILKTLGWNMIFIIMGCVGLLIAFMTKNIMPASNDNIITPKNPNEQSAGYLSVLRNKKAIGYLLVQGAAFGVLMSFLTNASYVYIEHFNTSEELFSFLLMLSVVAVAIINRVNSYLLLKHEPMVLVRVFLLLQLMGVGILILATTFWPQHLWIIVVGFMTVTGSMGGIAPNSTACFMNHFKHNAGVASATLGTMQYLSAAMISGIAAILSVNSLWPLILTMLITSLIASLGATIGYKANK